MVKKLVTLAICVGLIINSLKGQVITPESYPVTLGADTLFYIIRPIGSISADYRSTNEYFGGR